MIICIKRDNKKVKSINTKDISKNVKKTVKNYIKDTKCYFGIGKMIVGKGLNKCIEWTFIEADRFDKMFKKK